MKIWSADYVFDHPWETVARAVWRKYPNPFKPEVEATDVTDRRVENGKLYSKRLISSRWGLPDWAKKLIGTDKLCYAYEDSEVDPVEQSIITHSRNVTMSSSVCFEEKMDYRPDPTDNSRTIIKQQTIVTVKGVPLSSYIENYFVNCMSSNSSKGREAMEWIINKINLEVEELLCTCKQSTTKLTSSIEGIKEMGLKSIDDIQDTAKKSIEDIKEIGLKSIDDLQDTAKKSIGDIKEIGLKSIDDLQDSAKKSIGDVAYVTKKSIDGIDILNKAPSSPRSIPRI